MSTQSSLSVTAWSHPRRDFALGLPGSKSLTLRDCAIAALAEGPSLIRFPGECDDYRRMRDCLTRLGVAVTDESADAIRVDGRGGSFASGPIALSAGQSAVTTRLMLAFAALRPDVTELDGHVSMRARPNGPLVDALRALGATLEGERDGYLPIRVRGRRDLGSQVRLKADVSSQYLTALLIVAPLLPGGLEVIIEGELASKPYVDLTFDEMRKFGVEVAHTDYQKLSVSAGAYRAGEVAVEGDASAASYWAALATLHGGTVRIENLGAGTRQGDYGFFAICERLGATVTRTATETAITGPAPGELRALEGPIDMTQMPDVAPTLMVMAPLLPAPTHITGLSTLRVKECDRIAAPVRELAKLGVRAQEGADSVTIQPFDAPARKRQDAVPIETYHDHRIAMCFGVLGTLRPGLQILDPACVGKTYPLFWADLERARHA